VDAEPPLDEVDNVVAKDAAIAAIAVIGLPDEKWSRRLHAVVVLYSPTGH
jgi:acyl-CoA synthetase (AMP-forming)/AMP-acid ligase II